MYSLYEKTQGENSMTLEQQITAEEALYFNDELETREYYEYAECMAADEFNDDIFLEASNV
jgi:hypothetical protein